MSDALERRIADEERAKTRECAVIGCTNQATHTWSGHPTCDECALPMWKDKDGKLPPRPTFPRLI